MKKWRAHVRLNNAPTWGSVEVIVYADNMSGAHDRALSVFNVEAEPDIYQIGEY